MKHILAAIQQHALRRPGAFAVGNLQSQLNYAELQREIIRIADLLREQHTTHKVSALGLMLDNSPAWVVADLAAATCQLTCIPLPGYFSPAQLQHTLTDAGIRLLITDQPERFEENHSIASRTAIEIAGSAVTLVQLAAHDPAGSPQLLPAGISKVTYTSGTTGQPKGVCLRGATLDDVAQSLARAVRLQHDERHLCVLPLATLLENIGGVYAPLLAGAQCIIPSLTDVGLSGAARVNAEKLYQALYNANASTAIFTPQLLHVLTDYLSPRYDAPPGLPTLRFLAVGGAPVSPSLLSRAAECGLPVYEGYGLSECGSVVAVNRPDQYRSGSVGRRLPHVQIRIASDGEIRVRGHLYAGYLGEMLPDGSAPNELATGDIGYLDADDYLYITGRKKNMFITSFGRNIAPEWIERELTIEPGIAQAAVFGEGRPWNVAVIVPANGSSTALIDFAITRANSRLPDYARISNWLYADQPFSIANAQYTATGRPRRNAIWQHYAEQITALYEPDFEPRRESA